MDGPPLEVTFDWATESHRRVVCAGEIGDWPGVAGKEGGSCRAKVTYGGVAQDRGMGVHLFLTLSDRSRHRCRLCLRLVCSRTASSDGNSPDRHGSLSCLAAHGPRMVRGDAA